MSKLSCIFSFVFLVFPLYSFSQFVFQVDSSEVLVLSDDDKIDDKAVLISKLASGAYSKPENQTFNAIFTNTVRPAVKKGANVILITKIVSGMVDAYGFKAKAYKVDDYEAFKANALLEKQKFESETAFAILKVFRPSVDVLPDLKSMDLAIDDSVINIKCKQTYDIIIRDEKKITLKIKTGKTEEVDIKHGNVYYVKVIVNQPRMPAVPANSIIVPVSGYTPDFRIVTDKGGEVEYNLLKEKRK